MNMKIIGTTDTVCTCDCCGRTDLKKTVVLRAELSESVSYYGVACAARAMGRKTSKGLMNEAIDAQLIADREAKIQKKVAARRAELLEMSRKDFGVQR